MTDEQKTKANFISDLAETIYDYFPEIWKIEYYVDFNEEFIRVIYTNNCSRCICVTADSLSALMLDIGRYLCRH
jgi:hypothetical protein